MAESYSIAYIHNIFLIHAYIDGLLDCIHILAVENNTAVNAEVHKSFKLVFLFSLEKYPQVV